MRKLIYLCGLLTMLFLGSSLRPLVRATGLATFRDEPNTKGGVMMVSSQSSQDRTEQNKAGKRIAHGLQYAGAGGRRTAAAQDGH
jgi:hypothetical protein